MACQNNSGSDIFYPDDNFSCRGGLYSPVSNYSTYSHEVKYIFNPIQDDDTRADYSLISPRTKSNLHNSRTVSTSSIFSDHSVVKADSGVPHSMSMSSYGNYSLVSQSRHTARSPQSSHIHVNNMGGMDTIRSFNGNFNMEDMPPAPPMYDDADRVPPKLAPISGVLPQNPGQSIVRPIAFKPINSNKNSSRQVSPPHHNNRRVSNQEEVFRSQDFHSTTNTKPRNSSRGSHHGSDKSASFSSDASQTVGRPESLPSLNASRLSSNNNMESYLTTPSPSDSGVGELELMLKEKDAELNTLRDVMDKNERAIFQVYEEKKGAWLKEIREMKEDFDRKLKIHQRKSYKTEQLLSLQVYKLQQEKEELAMNFNKVSCEKEVLRQQCASYEEEIKNLRLKLSNSHAISPDRTSNESTVTSQLRKQVKDLSEEVAGKTNEVLKLRSHLHGSENEIHKKNTELTNKFKEIICKTEEVKALKNELGRLSTGEQNFAECATQTDETEGVIPLDLLKPTLLTEKTKAVSSLQNEVAKVKEKLDDTQDSFEKEREQWLDEKNKVIRYQKQLQLNYVQMYRKNRMLEAEVEQLTLELENRDLKLMALNGEESVC